MKILINNSIPQSIGFIIGAVLFTPLGIYGFTYFILYGVCNLLSCGGSGIWAFIVPSLGGGLGIALGGTLGQLIGAVYEERKHKNKPDKGFTLGKFTLGELLVVCLIISAITWWYVLPNMRDTVNKSRYNQISSMREVLYAQNIFYRKKGKFTANAEELYKDVKSYKIDFPKSYQVEASNNSLYLIFVPSEDLAYIGNFPFRRWRSRHVRSYVSAIFAKDRDSTIQVICALNKPARDIPNRPIFRDGKVTCSEGTFTIPETAKNTFDVIYPENP